MADSKRTDNQSFHIHILFLRSFATNYILDYYQYTRDTR